MNSQLLILSIFACVACISCGGMFGGGPEWDDLSVTWGPNPFSSSYFDKMPRTEAEAIRKGWKMEKNCSEVNGNRYILNGDKSVILIYSLRSGFIAGIASAVPKNLASYPSTKQALYLKNEGDQYTVNAYFDDPTTVCKPGKREVSNSARSYVRTGYKLVIESDTLTMEIPSDEADVSTPWSKGGCFPTMGRHYYAHVDGIPFTSEIIPSDILPVFLLYNKGRLNAFGWIWNAYLEGDRYEHAPKASASIFLPAVPSYWNNNQFLLSSIHIFLDSTPLLNFC